MSQRARKSASKPKSATTRNSLDPSWKKLVVSQAQVMQEFEQAARKALKPVLGAAGIRQIRADAAIVTPLRGAVIIHAPLKVSGKMSIERIQREKPFAAVLMTVMPLVDPVTETALQPGIYALRLRSVGGRNVAFDFLADGGRPAFSTLAQQKDNGGPWGLDIELDLPGDPDSLWPPPDNGWFCMSILHWKKCWWWGWPEIEWPDW
jgi:hypothetical protein